VAPRAASAAGSTMIISGSVITFGDGAEQRVAVWTWPTRRSAWTLHQLPDAGAHSEALSSGCAETCWISGHADGTVALWSLDPADPAGAASRDSTLPLSAWTAVIATTYADKSARMGAFPDAVGSEPCALSLSKGSAHITQRSAAPD
jgi:hypothetical protein